MRRGDVVLIVAPGDLGKPRPAVIVQADALGESTTTVLVCPMTSDGASGGLLRPAVAPTDGNGLRVASLMMTDKLVALKRDRIRTALGRLDEDAQLSLDRALLVVLGLAPG